MALKAKVSTAFKREAKVMGSEANKPNVVDEKSPPFPRKINLLFKPSSPRELHESGFNLLPPADPAKKLELCM